MASRVKEDEKNERIIRGLLKLQENRRCINCNSLGPQYVCTNFWTFVCTTCSGIHREFTHRVKSISMAKFTSQEVSALQEGGNQRAKEIYFKELDPQRHSFPDGSNVMKLRDFIKHVYVDRRYSGDRNFEKPPRGKTGEKEEFYETRRTDTYQGGSRSPPYEDRRYNERSSPGGRNFVDERRSPGSDQDNRQYGDFKRSPARPEVVNDWRREDRFGNGKRVEDGRLSDGDSKIGGRSPDRPNDLDSSSPPTIRPVRDILGENISPLRVIEPPKSSGSKVTDSSVHKQRTASSSSLGSISENIVETKVEPAGSLIDFDAEPEPIASAVPQPPQSSVPQSVTHTVTTNNDNNWASFDVTPQAPPAPPANVGTFESVLSQLSVSASVPGVSGPHGATGAAPAALVGNTTMLPTGFDPNFGSGGNAHMPPPFAGGAPSHAPVSGLSTFPPSGQWPNMQSQAHSLFPGGNSQPVAQQFPSSNDRSINQPWNASLPDNSQGPLSNPSAHAPQDFSSSAQAIASGVSHAPAPEVMPSGRKELPADLFALNYSSFAAPVPGWQTVPPRAMGYVMPYNFAMPMPSFPQSVTSTNPFDLSGEQSQFLSMAPLQNALPSGQPTSNLMRSSGYGNPASTWMPLQPPSNLSQLPPQAPYPSTMPSRPYMGQQVASNVQPYRHPGLGNYGNQGAAHGYADMGQPTASRFSAPATPNPFSSTGGNPFG